MARLSFKIFVLHSTIPMDEQEQAESKQKTHSGRVGHTKTLYQDRLSQMDRLWSTASIQDATSPRRSLHPFVSQTC